MPAPETAYVHLHAEGVSLVLDVSGGRLPAIVHWGADLGDLSAADCRVLADSFLTPVSGNLADTPLRVSLLPEHHRGWAGRPGLSGSRRGRDWSPHFVVDSVTADGTPVDGLVELGLGEVVVEATGKPPSNMVSSWSSPVEVRRSSTSPGRLGRANSASIRG